MMNLTSSTSFDFKAEIIGAYSAWDFAFNKADAKAVAATYVSNAKVLPPTHQVISGPEEIENFFAGLFSGGFTDHKLTIIDAGGDEKVVYSTAKWSAEGKGPDGSRQSAGGIATHVFERQADGSLKLRLHTFN
ncbi:nuclear transport factor 2 family protein [Bradyrhizobium sp. CCGB12]|uniref:YybH family protein n=1 Tax=Bradyrhizobium sp. CCGB12 TaxID=2949632 RepID=UPI0020B40DBB|nr:nuclear transport factor 2 family protein [Bradyrhizobium sp. CCGB12]MCP3392637.1 nuclear transport factor 2 family protein [Bradyrhizobium sp. CCGB12]